MAERLTNLAQTTLQTAITSNSQTNVVVASAARFPTLPNFRIRINSELMLVTGVAGTTFTVTRGVEGTTAATSHGAGADVRHVLSSLGLDTRVIEQVDAARRGVAAVGYAPLNASGKIDPAYLPAGAEIFRGTWNVTANTTSDSVSGGLVEPQPGFTSGMEYRVTNGPFTRLGETWATGDMAIYDGAQWQRIAGGGSVAGVTSLIGVSGVIDRTSFQTAYDPQIADIDLLQGVLDGKADDGDLTALVADTDLRVIGTPDTLSAQGGSAFTVDDGGKVFDMGAASTQIALLPAAAAMTGFPVNWGLEVYNSTTASQLEIRVNGGGALIECPLSTTRVSSVWVKVPWGAARIRMRQAAGFYSVSGDLDLATSL